VRGGALTAWPDGTAAMSLTDDRDQQIIELIPRLRRYARALTRNPDQADDLVQDCLERAWGRLHLWRRGSNMRAWLFTIMHNLHINTRRRLANRPDRAEMPDWEIGGGVQPIQEQIAEFRSTVAALHRLPEDQKVVLLLVAMEGLTYREAAGVLNLPIGTVMSRLARGRERLRQMTEEGGDIAAKMSS
jgi:RNA polymerase sigma-70 factor, ECF subfamily